MQPAFQLVWEKMKLQFDAVIRTTDPEHEKAVQSIFARIKDNGYIYTGEYAGQYCIRDEAYVANNAKICPTCGGKTEFIQGGKLLFQALRLPGSTNGFLS